MQCEKCKIKKATVFYSELDRTRHALCSLCASASRVNDQEGFDVDDTAFIPVSYLYELVHTNNGIYYSVSNGSSKLTCKTCGSDIESVTERGAMGCKDCYSAFISIPQLSECSMRLYGMFNKKIPRRYAIMQENKKRICELKDRLARSVANEDFESAVRLRDEIRSLEAMTIGE